MEDLSSLGFSGPLCPNPEQIIDNLLHMAQDPRRLRDFCTFSPSIYDSAWLSMLRSRSHGKIEWLFPECFDYVLASQQSDGSWPVYATLIDGILNTLAATLSLVVRSGVLQDNSLHSRIKAACAASESLLRTWAVGDTVHVGFEILVPRLLEQLRGHGITFSFDGEAQLMELYSIKMHKFKPEMVYTATETTILHSAEALIGLVDFDKLSHHCTEEYGICGSPSATSAYLMQASQWDERAERYLRRAVEYFGGRGRVPSAFPTSVFEFSWALSIFLSSALDTRDRAKIRDSTLADYLTDAFNDQSGLMGFTPKILADADDTARTYITLKRLGLPVKPTAMIEEFRSVGHFKTYQRERNPSMSANCNVLIALLETDASSIDSYIEHIEMAIDFLLGLWESGHVDDKWNLSPYYSRMLLTEALTLALRRYSTGNLQKISKTLICRRIPSVLGHILGELCRDQAGNGSWCGSPEVTAYAILTITYCLPLPWPESISGRLITLLYHGRAFVTSAYSNPPTRIDYLWVEKTTYSPVFLNSIYCAAALHSVTSTDAVVSWTPDITASFQTPVSKYSKIQTLISQLPLLQEHNGLPFSIIALQAADLTERLMNVRQTVVSRDEFPMTKDKYVQYIPCIWLLCNHFHGGIVAPNVVWEMAYISMLIYQIDECIESMAVRLHPAELTNLRELIAVECGLQDEGASITLAAGHAVIYQESAGANGSQATPDEERLVRSVRDTLRAFIKHVLQHPSVVRSPEWKQQNLAIEVHNFLVSHIDHISDNRVGLASGQSTMQKPMAKLSGNGYFRWVHTTASDDTSCPFSFQFFCCLIEDPTTAKPADVHRRYVRQTLAHHLAVMCRQYNDFGSADRDVAEGNLNSLHFPELQSAMPAPRGSEEVCAAGERSAVSNGDGVTNGAPNGESRPANGASHAGGMIVHANGHPEYVTTDADHSKGPLAQAQNDHTSWASTAKHGLMQVAEFERSIVQLTIGKLREVEPDSSFIKAVNLFVDVTDLFGQIYVAKDITSRKLK